MMLTKPKPVNDREASSSSPTIMNTNSKKIEIEGTTDDREKELERRLAMLGGTVDVDVDVDVNADETAKEDDEDAFFNDTTEEADPVEVEQRGKEDNLMSFDTLRIDPTPVLAPPVVETKPEPVKPAPVKPNKSALLARIMAAQERAKQAQLKQASSTAPPMEIKPTTVLPPPAQMKINVEQEKDKMMKALSGVVDTAMEKETKVDDFKPPPLRPPQFMPPPTSAPPMMGPPPMMAPPIQMAPSTMTAPRAMPPPSFDIFEQQQMKVVAPPPPAFNMIENDIPGLPGVQSPSAPPPEESLLDTFDGVTPMAPPPSYPGEQVEDSDAFDFDMDGNPLTPESKRKMMEEQRAIMEQIKKQASDNKASEAAVRANAFETRMMGHPTISAPTTTTAAPSEISGVSTEVDVGVFDAAEIEEQRKILEQIQKAANKSGERNYQSPDLASESSPVLTQNADQYAEEARQMEEDMKLAQRLQDEENAAESDYPANRRGAAASRSTAPEESSWWDTLMTGMGVSSGAEESGEKRSAEINMSRPPGSRMTPSQRALHSNDDYETEGLIGSGSNDRSARVAESKPLFSCVVDSVSNAATYAAAMTAGDDDEEVHGVDTSSFLAIPKVGDDRGGSGSYSAIPNDN